MPGISAEKIKPILNNRLNKGPLFSRERTLVLHDHTLNIIVNAILVHVLERSIINPVQLEGYIREFTSDEETFVNVVFWCSAIAHARHNGSQQYLEHNQVPLVIVEGAPTVPIYAVHLFLETIKAQQTLSASAAD